MEPFACPAGSAWKDGWRTGEQAISAAKRTGISSGCTAGENLLPARAWCCWPSSATAPCCGRAFGEQEDRRQRQAQPGQAADAGELPPRDSPDQAGVLPGAGGPGALARMDYAQVGQAMRGLLRRGGLLKGAAVGPDAAPGAVPDCPLPQVRLPRSSRPPAGSTPPARSYAYQAVARFGARQRAVYWPCAGF